RLPPPGRDTNGDPASWRNAPPDDRRRALLHRRRAREWRPYRTDRHGRADATRHGGRRLLGLLPHARAGADARAPGADDLSRAGGGPRSPRLAAPLHLAARSRARRGIGARV